MVLYTTDTALGGWVWGTPLGVGWSYPYGWLRVRMHTSIHVHLPRRRHALTQPRKVLRLNRVRLQALTDACAAVSEFITPREPRLGFQPFPETGVSHLYDSAATRARIRALTIASTVQNTASTRRGLVMPTIHLFSPCHCLLSPIVYCFGRVFLCFRYC